MYISNHISHYFFEHRAFDLAQVRTKSPCAPIRFAKWQVDFVRVLAGGNVTLGVHQQIARQTDNPLIRPTTGCGRQFGNGGIRYVNANYGEVAVCELPDVRATATTDRLRPVLVWVGADTFQKHGRRIHIATTISEVWKRCKH